MEGAMRSNVQVEERKGLLDMTPDPPGPPRVEPARAK
jgi:hypothetical protein